MSYRAYAAHRGCTLRAVQKAVGDVDERGIRSGRISDALVLVEGNFFPKIESDKADFLWELNTDQAKRSTLFAPSDASTPKSTTPGALAARAEIMQIQEVAIDDASDATKRSYHESRAQREKVNLEDAQLDLEERKGNLINIEVARQLGYTTLRALRDSLRNVGARVAPQLSVMTDIFACEQLINVEIDAVLSSVTLEKILVEPKDEDQADSADKDERVA
jgi:hypothetical protein